MEVAAARAVAAGGTTGPHRGPARPARCPPLLPKESPDMYDDQFTQTPRDEDHFWEMTRDNFEVIKQVLLEPIFETEEEAISGEHRRNAAGNISRIPMELIRYRNISPEYDNREYFYSLGRDLIPTVEEHIEWRQLTPAFAQDWGVIMFCHGYVAAHFFDDSDDLSKRRGGKAAAKETSKDAQRVWIARLLLR